VNEYNIVNVRVMGMLLLHAACVMYLWYHHHHSIMPLKLYVRRYDPPLALLRVINISMNPSSGPTSTNANKFNNDGYWKWKHMM
jgi:hypothetical protein